VNPRFLAVCLWVIGAFFAVTGAGGVKDAVKARKPALAAAVLIAVAALAGVLANAGADLW